MLWLQQARRQAVEFAVLVLSVAVHFEAGGTLEREAVLPLIKAASADAAGIKEICFPGV